MEILFYYRDYVPFYNQRIAQKLRGERRMIVFNLPFVYIYSFFIRIRFYVHSFLGVIPKI